MTTVQETQDVPEKHPSPKDVTPEVSVAVDAKDSSSAEIATESKLSGLRLAAVFTVLCLAVFLVALVSFMLLLQSPQKRD
jgi:hypothetical protein